MYTRLRSAARLNPPLVSRSNDPGESGPSQTEQAHRQDFVLKRNRFYQSCLDMSLCHSMFCKKLRQNRYGMMGTEVAELRLTKERKASKLTGGE
jgi:hypothetical protein